MTTKTIKPSLTKRTKAILCVHLAGWPCEMDEIMSLAQMHNLFVIEDCAQAHGATYKERSVGSIGHIGTWSFCQDKIITTGGEGGMVVTNNNNLWQKMWSYKDHGKSYEAVDERKQSEHYQWLHESFGTNYRMTEIQATIGRMQLKKISDWQKTRARNAKIILECCEQFPSIFRVARPKSDIQHAWYKCYVYLRLENLKNGWSRNRIIDEINTNSVPCYSGSCSEIYLEKAFDDTDFKPKERLPIARELGETSLMFLVHPTLSKDAMDQTCSAISKVAQLASQ